MFVEIFIFFLLTIVFLLYYRCKYTYSYWLRHGVPQFKPIPFIGDMKEAIMFKRNFGLHVSDIYNEPEMADKPIVGIYIFNQPALIIRDLDLIKSILIKDFNYFSNRYGKCDPHRDALGTYNLFFARDAFWKEMRVKISPVFTSGKIKQMYPLIRQIGCELEDFLAQKSDTFVADLKYISSLYTTDSIATIAFGINANSLKNPNGEFRMHTQSFFSFNFWRFVEFSVCFFLPKLVNIFKVTMFSKKFSKFLRSAINDTIDERDRKGYERNDLIDILVKLRKEAAEGKHSFTDSDFLVAQAGVFLTAGFETSSSTMAFCLYELAKQPNLQEKLRKEIHEALLESNGNLTYEKISSLQYLNMVLEETLRLYPILPFLDRQYQAPSDEKHKIILEPFYNFALRNGTPVYIPIYALQRDPKYWKNPEIFDPERFSAENKKLHHPMTYLPFGTGPHNCIGMRIGLLQSKVGLVHFLKNHHVAACKETPKEAQFNVMGVILQFQNGVHLVVKRDNMYDQISLK
uniref:Cytochrome P450 n=1 Tax=Glossina palpalis gambiensis TaxID=67801 RepID=A0A1B0BSR5_9MUSC